MKFALLLFTLFALSLADYGFLEGNYYYTAIELGKCYKYGDSDFARLEHSAQTPNNLTLFLGDDCKKMVEEKEGAKDFKEIQRLPSHIYFGEVYFVETCINPSGVYAVPLYFKGGCVLSDTPGKYQKSKVESDKVVTSLYEDNKCEGKVISTENQTLFKCLKEDVGYIKLETNTSGAFMSFIMLAMLLVVLI
ncbi:hypothetical protein EIN_369740 [Entamoeba invadens IP1]|uniref:Uncharacterized protein n=1 Tax=Entamoeba invadens IP1 TaxID=370355 RepID=A0A0A1UGG8_ENTIV|nr:hypothetical protein EIN_369740 [Entamoeba invadens IP1]ELP92652.1 hypothetical protein EIN_369740 [Entamoeba invadens IP1]|eukprot:XP_004259423.1 hypothetical protein EIN_369740 [Entamoeba invadens IP1]